MPPPLRSPLVLDGVSTAHPLILAVMEDCSAKHANSHIQHARRTLQAAHFGMRELSVMQGMQAALFCTVAQLSIDTDDALATQEKKGKQGASQHRAAFAARSQLLRDELLRSAPQVAAGICEGAGALAWAWG